MRSIRWMAAATALAILAMAASASAAFATVHFSNTEMTWSGTLTLKKNGGSAVNCTIKHPGWTAGPKSGEFVVFVEAPSAVCSNGKSFTWEPEGAAKDKEEGGTHHFSLEFHDGFAGWHAGPWGNWSGEAVWATVPWTNGSGSTASTITFENTKIGETQTHESVTATGTVKVAAPGGKLITLIP